MKKILILSLVLAGLGAFVYFYEIKGGEEREAAKELEESLLRVEEGAVTGIQIERPGADPIEITRSGNSWRLSQPVDSSVDRFVVDALVRDLAAAKKVRTLEEVSEKLADFGLAEPRLQLTINAASRQQVLKLGKQDYTGSQIYVQLEGEDNVYLTPRSLLTSADKQLKDWRSKTVLDFEQDEVQVVELQRPAGDLRLERAEGQWRITDPVEDVGDDSNVSSLLSTVKYARIEDFVVEEASEEALTEHGLARPRYELRLKPTGGDEWKTLQLGDKQDDKYYARDLSRRTIFTVRGTLTDNLDKPVEHYRDKKIVKVRQDELDRFLMRRGEDTIEVRREGEAFTVLQPEPEKGSATAPYKFWYPITDAKFLELDDAKSPPSDARFKDPDVRLEITTRDGTTRSFEFVQQGQAYLARRLEDGRSGTISATDFQKIKLEGSLATPSG